jgi:hypothetical protein
MRKAFEERDGRHSWTAEKEKKHRDGEEDVRKQSGDGIQHRIAPNF